MKNSYLFLRRTLTSLVFAAIMITLLTYCSKEENLPIENSILAAVPQTTVNVAMKQSVLKSAHIVSAVLYAGQSTPVGTVSISQIENNPALPGPDALQVTYKMDDGTLKDLHLWLGTDLTDILNNGNNPQLQKFPFKATANKSEYSFVIPFSSTDFPYSPCTAANLMVAAKADVEYKDKNGNVKTDGAWACTTEIFTGKNWSTYFTYELKDETLPTASNPEPVTVQCIGDVPTQNTEVVTDEADNCGTPVVVFVKDESDGNTCPETITRTYSVTDKSDNFILVTQTITVHDVTRPTIANAIEESEITGCSVADLPTAKVNVSGLEELGLEVSDNCTLPAELKVNSVDQVGTGCPITVTRTYTVSDACNNEETVVQTFRIVDKTAPSLESNTAEISLTECGVVPDAQFVKPTFSDNCNGLIEVNKAGDDIADKISAPGYILYKRTWIAKDPCGNASGSVSQTVKVPVCNWTGGITGNPEWKPKAGSAWAYDFQAVPAKSISITTNSLDKAGNNWGWTNGQIYEGETKFFRLYVCAGKNDLTKGTWVGDMKVSYSGTTVTVEYQVTPLCNIAVAHIYVGADKLPRNKKGYISAPGQLGYNSGPLTGQTSFTHSFSSITGPVYVAAHAEIILKP